MRKFLGYLVNVSNHIGKSKEKVARDNTHLGGMKTEFSASKTFGWCIVHAEQRL